MRRGFTTAGRSRIWNYWMQSKTAGITYGTENEPECKRWHSGFCMSEKLDWLKTIKLDILNIPDNRYNLQQDNQCGPERILKRLRKGD